MLVPASVVSALLFFPSAVVAGRPLDSLVPTNKDDDAFPLLLGILELNTQLRLTATQALDHAFLDIVPAIPTTPASPESGTAAKTRTGATGESADNFR